MKTPEWLGPGIWGVVIGAIGLAIVEFSTGWVVTSGSADNMAAQRANTAVVSALTPICVAQFVNSAKASAATPDSKAAQAKSEGALLAALKKTEEWERSDFVAKKGWATMPGSTKPNDAVAESCAQKLASLAKKKTSKS